MSNGNAIETFSTVLSKLSSTANFFYLDDRLFSPLPLELVQEIRKIGIHFRDEHVYQIDVCCSE